MSKSSPEHGLFTHIKGELAWTIAEHRSPSAAITLTRHLTDADEGRFELLGLVNGCEAALYWDYVWNHVVAAGFDTDGVADLARDVPEKIRYICLGEVGLTLRCGNEHERFPMPYRVQSCPNGSGRRLSPAIHQKQAHRHRASNRP